MGDSGFIWWVPLVALGVVIGIPAAVAAVSSHRGASRRRHRALRVDDGDAPAAAAVAGYLARLRRWRSFGLILGVAAALPVAWLVDPRVAGLTVVGGYLLGALTAEATVPVPASGPVRTAELRVRRAVDYVNPALLATDVVLVLVAIAAVPALALRPGRATCAGVPLPGVPYDWPALPTRIGAAAVAVGGLAACVVVVRRAARRSRPAEPVDTRVDDRLRQGSARAATVGSFGLPTLVLGLLGASLSVPACGTYDGAATLVHLMNWTGYGLMVLALVSIMFLDGAPWGGRRRPDRAPVR